MKTYITLLELQQLIMNKANIVILDVRSKEEYEEKHIPMAMNISMDEIELGDFVTEPGKIVITACGKGGGRSEKAANYLRAQTNVEVYFLQGGTFGYFENLA